MTDIDPLGHERFMKSLADVEVLLKVGQNCIVPAYDSFLLALEDKLRDLNQHDGDCVSESKILLEVERLLQLRTSLLSSHNYISMESTDELPKYKRLQSTLIDGVLIRKLGAMN